MKAFMVTLLAGASFIGGAAPALAQQTAPGAAANLTTEEVAARAALLEQQVQALQQELNALKKQVAAVAPSWKGAPQLEDKDKGWSFKPFGRLNYDLGWVGHPDGVSDRGLGFSNELRRARLGVEGTIPGGFGYKLEVDFADNEIEVTDAILSYAATKNLGIVLGQHNNFQSLEELTSSRFTSFMERAAFTDAFNFERRVGVSATYNAGDVIASGGVFTDNIDDLNNDENNAVSVGGRLVYAPKAAGTQLHFGGSAHLRDNGDVAEAGGTTRYRQRPFVHTTDTRFLATPALRVGQESNYGLEAAAIRGPFHAAGEVHWLKADRIGAARSPTFFGGYAEVGYYLTGETRGYKNGRFDRTKVLKPVGGGGLGAFQVNLRYDHLDLSDAGVIGGRQQGYAASLIWIPHDHVRFLLNYAHLVYDDAAVAAAGGDRSYGIDVFGARAQIDF